MNLYKIDNATARQILQALAASEPVLWPAIEKKSLGEESRLADDHLRTLNVRMIDVMASISGGGIERRLTSEVRESIQVSGAVAGEPGFWRWLSVKYFFDAVQARHSSQGELAKEANFGIGGRFEGLIARLWFRAEVAYDKSAPDPYWLAGRGDQDFWRSHILRVRYSNARSFVRELIKFQYPRADGSPRLRPSGQDGIRTLVKRIQAFHASSALELASSAQVPPMLERLSADLAPGGVT